MGFAFDIKQDLSRPSADYVKSVLHQDFTKGLENRPVLEVHLKTFHREVKQLWQADLPWPAYSDNGSTISRLVKVTPAAKTP